MTKSQYDIKFPFLSSNDAELQNPHQRNKVDNGYYKKALNFI